MFEQAYILETCFDYETDGHKTVQFIYKLKSNFQTLEPLQ